MTTQKGYEDLKQRNSVKKKPCFGWIRRSFSFIFNSTFSFLISFVLPAHRWGSEFPFHATLTLSASPNHFRTFWSTISKIPGSLPHLLLKPIFLILSLSYKPHTLFQNLILNSSRILPSNTFTIYVAEPNFNELRPFLSKFAFFFTFTNIIFFLLYPQTSTLILSSAFFALHLAPFVHLPLK